MHRSLAGLPRVSAGDACTHSCHGKTRRFERKKMCDLLSIFYQPLEQTPDELPPLSPVALLPCLLCSASFRNLLSDLECIICRERGQMRAIRGVKTRDVTAFREMHRWKQAWVCLVGHERWGWNCNGLPSRMSGLIPSRRMNMSIMRNIQQEHGSLQVRTTRNQSLDFVWSHTV